MRTQTEAKKYAKLGFKVFPVDPSSKKPLIRGWQHRATTDYHQIKKWWRQFPWAGIATLCGPEHGHVVVDVDTGPDKVGFETLAALEAEYGKLPETLTARTKNGGLHLYYRNTDILPRKINGLGKNIDFLTNGYTILPGTPGYSWENETVLADLPTFIPSMLGLCTTVSERVEGCGNRLKTGDNINPIDNLSLLLGSRRYGGVTFEFIDSLYKTEWVNQKVADYLGLPNNFVSQTDAIKSILPGHEDKNPSTQLMKKEDGWWLYRDFSEHYGQAHYNFPQLYAAIRYKQYRKMSSSEWMTWAFKLLVDAGVVRIPKISNLTVYRATNRTFNQVLQGFIQLMSLKSFIPSFDGKTAFSKDFAAAWCQVAPATAHRAKCWLMDNNYIAMVEVHRNRYGNTCGLFKLGTTIAKLTADKEKHGYATDPTGDLRAREETEKNERSVVQGSVQKVQSFSEPPTSKISRYDVDGNETFPTETHDSRRRPKEVNRALSDGSQLEEDSLEHGMGPVGAVYWEDEDIYWEGFVFSVPQWRNLQGDLY